MNGIDGCRLQNGSRKQKPIQKSPLEETNKIKKNLGTGV